MHCEDVQRLRAFLDAQGTFEFPVLSTGLFSAARLAPGAEYTGYHNVWVRDNIHIAHAHFVHGQAAVAAGCVKTLARYFGKHAWRFQRIIDQPDLAADPMNRPHIRFNGETLEENSEKWSHAQNDALGYFLWLYCKLALAEEIAVSQDEKALLALFPQYFQAIRYWQDEDSGHWEEARKIEASSIGVVVAGLRELRSLCGTGDRAIEASLVDDLIEQGDAALKAILPCECIQPEHAKNRHADAALLFLIHPLGVVEGEMAARIIADVEGHLLGEYGIRRYLGDSFWCADYKDLQTPELRTADVSADMSARDALLVHGQEAQWCIFDPILSAAYGTRYAETRDRAMLERQVHYLDRSLRQLTGTDLAFPEYRCPELYFLQHGHYVPNDVTPLLWTQANLSVALDWMQRSAILLDALAPDAQNLHGAQRLAYS